MPGRHGNDQQVRTARRCSASASAPPRSVRICRAARRSLSRHLLNLQQARRSGPRKAKFAYFFRGSSAGST